MTCKSKRHWISKILLKRKIAAKIHATSCNIAKMITKSKKKIEKNVRELVENTVLFDILMFLFNSYIYDIVTD